MKTSFNIAWVDDNFSDPSMDLVSRLKRKIKRKNGFSLNAIDVYAEVTKGDFDGLLAKLAAEIDLSNSFDLILIDYELGNQVTGEKIAHKFRAKLPSLDIVFYSGKNDADSLRQLIANENVDGVNCVGRKDLVAGTYGVIENVINRSHKISTLRGLILNSVCEMDHMIREVLCKYYIGEEDEVKKAKIKNEVVRVIGSRNGIDKTRLENMSFENNLDHKNMMSGRLFSVFEFIKVELGLSRQQLELLGLYRSQILDLRTSAAHAKEAVCKTTGHSMLKFKNNEYKRSDIDDICKKIVNHENNIQSILVGLD